MLRTQEIFDAIVDGTVDEARQLLNAYPAVVFYRDDSGLSQTMLHVIAIDDRPRLGAVLLAHGSDLNAINELGHTALHTAAMFGSYHVVHLLIDRGAPANQPASDGRTPLHLTVARIHHKDLQAHLHTIDALIAGGANINAQTKQGESVLAIAKQSNYPSVHAKLIEYGAR